MDANLYEIATPVGAGTKAKLPAAGVKAPGGVKDLSKNLGSKVGAGKGQGAKGGPGQSKFTGVMHDKIGRKQYYQDGVHVKNPSPAQKAAIEGTGKTGKVAIPIAKEIKHAIPVAKHYIEAVRQGNKSPAHAAKLVQHLATMPAAQLQQLAQEYKLKAPVKVKAPLVQKLKETVPTMRAAAPGSKAQAWAQGVWQHKEQQAAGSGAVDETTHDAKTQVDTAPPQKVSLLGKEKDAQPERTGGASLLGPTNRKGAEDEVRAKAAAGMQNGAAPPSGSKNKLRTDAGKLKQDDAKSRLAELAKKAAADGQRLANQGKQQLRTGNVFEALVSELDLTPEQVVALTEALNATPDAGEDV